MEAPAVGGATSVHSQKRLGSENKLSQGNGPGASSLRLNDDSELQLHARLKQKSTLNL